MQGILSRTDLDIYDSPAEHWANISWSVGPKLLPLGGGGSCDCCGGGGVAYQLLHKHMPQAATRTMTGPASAADLTFFQWFYFLGGRKIVDVAAFLTG